MTQINRLWDPLARCLVFSFLISIGAYSCVPNKRTAAKSGKNHFESFYAGENGMQYFIKPILMKNTDKEEFLTADFTFRHRNESTDSVTLNFSIEGPELYKKIDSLQISSGATSIASHRIGLLFSERTGKGFVSRYTAKVSLNEVQRLFGNQTWDCVVHIKGSSSSYLPTPKSERKISAINADLFTLM